MTFMGMTPLGNLASGAIAQRVGAPPTVAVGGLVCVAASAWFLRSAWLRRGAAAAATAAALLILLGGAPARAQLAPVAPERAVARTLTWEDCVTLALDRNPDLASASRASEAGKASYFKSYNGLLPSLTLSNSYATSKTAGGLPSYSAQGAAGMTLFDAGTIAGIRTAKAS
jgi:outer membrane protein TolC